MIQATEIWVERRTLAVCKQLIRFSSVLFAFHDAFRAMGERRTWVSAEKSVLADSCCERRQEQGPYNNLHRSEKKQIPPRCSCDVCVCVCVCVCVSQ